TLLNLQLNPHLALKMISLHRTMLEDELTQGNHGKLTRLSASLHIFQSLIQMADACLRERVEASITFSPASGSITPIQMILHKNHWWGSVGSCPLSLSSSSWLKRA